MKFPKEQLLDILYGHDLVDDKIVDVTRWSIVHEVVFRVRSSGPIATKFYRVRYSRGATEMQDERPWEGMNDVECEEVTQIPVTVLQWVPVNG